MPGFSESMSLIAFTGAEQLQAQVAALMMEQ
jgi:hypothetical protein